MTARARLAAHRNDEFEKGYANIKAALATSKERTQTMRQIIDFILELEKLKGVTRRTRPLGLNRYENSAEHSWQLALFAISLECFAESPIDINRVVRMLLVHDIGEIDTGDTIFFAEGGWEERKAAELNAVKRIFGLLPEDQAADFLALWQEFDQAETTEALFAQAVDRAMPVLLNLANEGQSWRENGISYDRVVRRIKPPIQAGCPALWNYLEVSLQQARDEGLFGA
jgi:putative hydrolases of HD superfamily